MVVIAARRQKRGLGAVTGDQVKPQHVGIEMNGAVKIGDFQVNMPDTGFWV